jgi:hypothetical protein
MFWMLYVLCYYFFFLLVGLLLLVFGFVLSGVFYSICPNKVIGYRVFLVVCQWRIFVLGLVIPIDYTKTILFFKWLDELVFAHKLVARTQ